jgi:hypothetical protein
MNDELIPALRRLGAEGLPDCFLAADALEAQAARIAELEARLAAEQPKDELAELHEQLQAGDHIRAGLEAELAHIRAEQGDPVAWMDPEWPAGTVEVESAFLDFKPHDSCGWIPVYAHPPSQPVSGAVDPVVQSAGEQTGPVSAAPTLTDSELLDLADGFRSQYMHGGITFDEFDALGFARAVLAAAQERKP